MSARINRSILRASCKAGHTRHFNRLIIQINLFVFRWLGMTSESMLGDGGCDPPYKNSFFARGLRPHFPKSKSTPALSCKGKGVKLQGVSSLRSTTGASWQDEIRKYYTAPQIQARCEWQHLVDRSSTSHRDARATRSHPPNSLPSIPPRCRSYHTGRITTG